MQKKINSFQENILALPLWACGFNALMDRHRDIEPEFHEIIQDLIKDIPHIYRQGTLKNSARVWAKTFTEFNKDLSQIDDIIRGTFVTENFSELQKIDKALENFAATYNITFQRRDKFASDQDNLGKFRSIMYKFDFGNQIRAEVQLNVSDFDIVYQTTHDAYEIIRELEDIERNSILTPEQWNLLRTSRETNYSLHSAAWQNVRDDYNSIYGQSRAID